MFVLLVMIVFFCVLDFLIEVSDLDLLLFINGWIYFFVWVEFGCDGILLVEVFCNDGCW